MINHYFPSGDKLWSDVVRRRVREMFEAVYELPGDRDQETEEIAAGFRREWPTMLAEALGDNL